jgi:hypothetical protein
MAPWNLAAIAVGKHVLTEQPFASNAEVSSGRQREERVVTSRWAGRTAIPLRYCSPHGTVLSCTTSSGSILVICWYLLDGDCDYHDLGGDFFIRRDSDRARQRAVAQLQALGYHVTLQPAA